MILVTGGTGMLGSHLLLELIKRGNKVRAIKRATSRLENVLKVFSYYEKNPEELFTQIEWFEADVLDMESILAAMQDIDFVYHTAAMVSFDPRDKYRMIENNVRGTANLVNASLISGIKKICHVSSISALGSAGENEEITELSFRNPKGRYSGYSISKFRSEMEIWRGITEGLDAVIVNPSIILGPGDWSSASPGIFSNIDRGLRFYTRGITGYVDVLDVVKAMISLMESDVNSERFIISAENWSFNELFSKIATALGKRIPTIHAGLFLLGIAWRFEKIRSMLTGKTPLVTKDSAQSAIKKNYFSSKKLIETIDFKYMSINDSIERIAHIYKNDHSR